MPPTSSYPFGSPTGGSNLVSQNSDFFGAISQAPWFHDLKLFLVVLSFVLFVVLLYVAYLIYELHHHDQTRLSLLREEYQSEKKVGRTSETWEAILEHLHSASPSDWKLAILEADTMLDDMLRGMGYPGENMGERLKVIRKDDMQTLDLAWEAHKVRNRIAHEGMRYDLTQTEARHVVGLYGKVFAEFGYVTE